MASSKSGSKRGQKCSLTDEQLDERALRFAERYGIIDYERKGKFMINVIKLRV